MSKYMKGESDPTSQSTGKEDDVEVEDLTEDGDEADDKSKTKYELNLNPEYWVKHFLYPFALDPAPLRLDASK